MRISIHISLISLIFPLLPHDPHNIILFYHALHLSCARYINIVFFVPAMHHFIIFICKCQKSYIMLNDCVKYTHVITLNSLFYLFINIIISLSQT